MSPPDQAFATVRNALQSPTMQEGTPDKCSFRDFDISNEILEALDAVNFVHPTPIQERTLPHGLRGADILGQAQTGTGKTLAFGIPVLERIDATRISAQALILLPTRELAQQVAEHLELLAAARGLKVALLVGGEKVRYQRARIPGRQVVVGTPGRILDLLRERLLHVEWVECLVLDEFDRMLDMGFIDDVRQIAGYTSQSRQTMLFSATAPSEILRLADGFLKDPVRIAVSSGLTTAARAEQRGLRVGPDDRLDVLLKLIEHELAREPTLTVLVFANTRRAVAELDREFWGRGLPAAALSGDFEQSRRFAVMEGFRERRIRVLVATDVASRGLDVDHVGHVINYDVPLEMEDYVHRIGRTARAGRTGRVTTLVVPAQDRYFRRLLAAFRGEIKTGTVRSPLSRRPTGHSPSGNGRGRSQGSDTSRHGGTSRPASGRRGSTSRGGYGRRPSR